MEFFKYSEKSWIMLIKDNENEVKSVLYRLFRIDISKIQK